MIKVITGIRRCGKSTLMELFQAELLLDGVPDSQIIAVNLEDFANIELRDPMSCTLIFCRARETNGHMSFWMKFRMSGIFRR